jgi:hypothetical protein
MAKQICFMVMPFSKKKTGLNSSQGPTEVDFDALWENAFAPALVDLGYTPVRADQDVGALIILDMIERLAYSDLVVADISTPNGNVYYEIGVRHAAKRRGCVLVSADWGRALFDIDQMPRLVYPIDDGSVPEPTAKKIREALQQGLPALATGTSPVFQAVPEFTEGVKDSQRAKSFAEDMEALNTVVSKIQAVPKDADPKSRRKKALALRDELEEEQALQEGVQMAVMLMLRDNTDWQTTLNYIEGRSETFQQRPIVKEQMLFAQAKLGDDLDAIAALQQLIDDLGPTPERWGLIGGRYKTLYDRAMEDGKEQQARVYLSKGIEAYDRGMMTDLNEYYPACNLPRLLRIRGEEGDLEEARALRLLINKACDRAEALSPSDEWIPLTRLGAAFDAEDPKDASRIARRILRESEASWKKNTTIKDLRRSVELVREPATRRELQKVLMELEASLPEEEQITELEELAASAPEVEPTPEPPQPAPAAALETAAAEAPVKSVETTKIAGKGVVVTIHIEAAE